MTDPRNTLACHIAAAAIVYQFGSSFDAALACVHPERLAPQWFEAADLVISITQRPGSGLVPPDLKQ